MDLVTWYSVPGSADVLHAAGMDAGKRYHDSGRSGKIFAASASCFSADGEKRPGSADMGKGRRNFIRYGLYGCVCHPADFQYCVSAGVEKNVNMLDCFKNQRKAAGISSFFEHESRRLFIIRARLEHPQEFYVHFTIK